ncbi:hypothetical protein L798_04623 [Zootermopsis nevadensis]|uniref:Uncharacterized protein n=1 Tax=Zootermopsis nevadensis TaxID=136037 RepID=A0A067QSL0_ZOONE|nr:hypothetical protein L798_04623 [Zootermopsis nevadensis]
MLPVSIRLLCVEFHFVRSPIVDELLHCVRSSKPNMSRIPIKPSVAWRTALLRAAMDLLDLEPAVPTVEACWLAICSIPIRGERYVS